MFPLENIKRCRNAVENRKLEDGINRNDVGERHRVQEIASEEQGAERRLVEREEEQPVLRDYTRTKLIKVSYRPRNRNPIVGTIDD